MKAGNKYRVDKLADVDSDDPEFVSLAVLVDARLMLESIQEVRLLLEAVERQRS